MGLFEDIVRKLAVELIAPAIKKTREYFGIQYTAVIALFGAKLQLFFEWIFDSNISIFKWVRNEIKEAIDEIDTGDWSFNLWIGSIIDAVFDAVKHLFVRVADLISSVQDIIADWWVGTLETVKNTISSMIEMSLDFISTNFIKFTDWVKTLGKTVAEFIADSIKKASDLIEDTVSNIIEDISGILNTIADSLLPAISNLQDAITDLGISFAKDILETGNKFADLLLTEIDKVMKYIDEEVPKMVGGLFDWALPIVQPIINAVGFLEDIVDVVTGTYKDAPEYKETQKKIQDKTDEIKKIIDTLE